MNYGQLGKVRRGGDPMKAQAFRTQRAELPEDLWQPLYDRANLGAAAAAVTSQVSFFSTARGQSATLITSATTAASKVKTYRDTNMENSNVVPTKLFKFVGVSIAIIHGVNDNDTAGTAANGYDRQSIMNGGYLQFRIVDKDILFLPLISLPELNPWNAVSTTQTAQSVMGSGSGGGIGQAMYAFPVPITLNPYENFSVTANFDATPVLTATADMYVILHGFMRRPT